MATFTIPMANLPRLETKLAEFSKKIERMNRRHGQSFPAITFSKGETIRRDVMCVDGISRPFFFVEVEVTGPEVKVGGWEFIAALTHEGEAGTIIRASASSTVAEGELARFRDAKPCCDHCKQDRRRNDTFVLRNATGDLKQVGSTCLVDFTGHATAEQMARMAELMGALRDCCSAEEENDMLFGGARTIFGMDEFMPFVAAAIREFGWTSRTKAREQGGEATADAAMNAIMDPGSKLAKMLVPTVQDMATVKASMEWAANFFDTNENLNDYESNVKVVMMSDVVSHKTAGIAASVIGFAQRGMARELEAKMAQNSNHVGTIGKREIFAGLTLTRVNSFESQFGVTMIYNFRDPNGNHIVWMSSGGAGLEQGKTYSVKGTVKTQDEYKGVKQTKLSRCVCTEIGAK